MHAIHPASTRTRLVWSVLLLPALALSCGRPVSVNDGGADTGQQSDLFVPATPLDDIDILFVIDNSDAMGSAQEAISRAFLAFIDALRCPSLNNRIPNVHIGIVTSDLGAGNYGLPSCEVKSGDGAKLQAQPRFMGCTPPAQPFIAHVEGLTNINSATTDPVQQVKEAFQCVALVGSGGCNFEHQLEAARAALDPKLAINPGFVRKNALLAVVFFTDEDDCSARRPQLFDPNQSNLSDPLGPLTSFRCFEFGIQCDVNDRTLPGPRTGCQPAGDWLYSIDRYVTFFKGLKPPTWLLMAAIAGPSAPVEVKIEGQIPMLQPSCKTSAGSAGPAIRLEALIRGFGEQGLFNTGIDATLTHDVPVNLCSVDYSPALRKLGHTILDRIDPHWCVRPPLTADGNLTCHGGDTIPSNVGGLDVICQRSCLEQADCTVSITLDPNQNISVDVPRCAPAAFAHTDDMDCGATCPCWRIVPDGTGRCLPRAPYRLDILTRTWPMGSAIDARCKTADDRGVEGNIEASVDLATLPQCGP